MTQYLQYHPQIRLLHITFIACSGLFLALRGVALLAGQHWPKEPWAHYLGYGIDTMLLCAAFTLLVILPGAVFANGWLHVKVILATVYFTLSYMITHGERSRRALAWLLISTTLVYLQIYSIARAHHPLGLLYVWLR